MMRNVPIVMRFLEYSVWLIVVVLALILQVSPFMLALTLMVYSLGATASASLAFTACVFALIFLCLLDGNPAGKDPHGPLALGKLTPC